MVSLFLLIFYYYYSYIKKKNRSKEKTVLEPKVGVEITWEDEITNNLFILLYMQVFHYWKGRGEFYNVFPR